ncbi:MAG: AraC family transcriptional regulator [Bacteroidota bacterium]
MLTQSFYFALSDFDKNWGIHILDCGTIHRKPNDQPERNNHPKSYQLTWAQGRILEEYQLIYLMDGSGWFESQSSGLIPIAAGSIVLVFPDLWHRYKPAEGSAWHTYWVGFGGPFTPRLIRNLEITPMMPVHPIGSSENVRNCFQEVLNVAHYELSGYQQVMAGEVVKLLGLLHATQRQAAFADSGTDLVIQTAKSLLIQMQNPKSMEAVADELNMGYSKFRKLFKHYTGMSPGQFQLQHQIAQATQLLRQSELSISEVAYQCGFDTLPYFTRMFKKKTGKTPSTYRKQFYPNR